MNYNSYYYGYSFYFRQMRRSVAIVVSKQHEVKDSFIQIRYLVV